MISRAVSAQVERFPEHNGERGHSEGWRALARNGYSPERAILSDLKRNRVKLARKLAVSAVRDAHHFLFPVPNFLLVCERWRSSDRGGR